MRNERTKEVKALILASVAASSASASRRDFQNLDFYAHDVQTKCKANARDSITFWDNRKIPSLVILSNAVTAKISLDALEG